MRPDEEIDASARDVSSTSETSMDPKDGLALRFATSRGSTVAAADCEALDNVTVALIKAQTGWLRSGDKRALRRALLALLGALEE
jgi:hypothetical protein